METETIIGTLPHQLRARALMCEIISRLRSLKLKAMVIISTPDGGLEQTLCDEGSSPANLQRAIHNVKMVRSSLKWDPGFEPTSLSRSVCIDRDALTVPQLIIAVRANDDTQQLRVRDLVRQSLDVVNRRHWDGRSFGG